MVLSISCILYKVLKLLLLLVCQKFKKWEMVGFAFISISRNIFFLGRMMYLKKRVHIFLPLDRSIAHREFYVFLK
jgi:hypothetical protein